ncbi:MULTISPECIES: ArsC family reductase [unclassified Guyparkeria]|uniref:ArsC family reductase n=1 Tax=unclassified Guyparkeria TaxID=2626246 RepID=UPI000733652A|nr:MULTISPECIES: ArsC family reductase [unclassified Guyparkeria]KTG16574.1 arsenate reductase [Guyparkeria sp. XI15]OAE85608.1 arsenate reductase [Guyparkeria sp. WRN-7]
MITVYGIPNCNSVKKARTWLDEQGLAYTFHDFKKAGLPEERLDHWLERFGWETVINRRGTSWRRLPAAEREAMDTARAREAAIANPSLIKRPVVESDEQMLIGFDADNWQEALA